MFHRGVAALPAAGNFLGGLAAELLAGSHGHRPWLCTWLKAAALHHDLEVRGPAW